MKGLLSFGLPFFFKVIIPGIVGALILSPLMASVGVRVGINEEIFTASFLNISMIFLGLALFIGLLVNFLDDIVYKIFEGLRIWPRWLRRCFTNRLNKKIEKKMQKIEKAKETKDKVTTKKLRSWLMMFPLKENRKEAETEAVLPTKLGNILSSYESYPKSKYGINAIFFWWRLWLAIDKETRNEINMIWAEADCLTYISFIFFSSSVLNLFAFLFDLVNIPSLILGPIGRPIKSIGIGDLPFTPFFFVVVGIVSLILAHFSYSISLGLHVRNGCLFKSLFDLHRDKLKKVITTKESGAINLEETWAYLKYGLKKCNKCPEYYPIEKKECPYCKKN